MCPDNSPTNTQLDTLMKYVAHSPEHHLLTRLIGEWEIAGEWYLMPGETTLVQGRTVNRGILGGHFIESISYFDDEEKSRAIYGFDPEDDCFMVFAISALATRCDLEYGHYDKSTNTLRFNCIEYAGPQRTPIKFERTLLLQTNNAYTMRVTYPEFEPERQLGMELRMQRSAT